MKGLLDAFKLCRSEKVTITKLADQYVELHGKGPYNDMLKKCSPNKRLKSFLMIQPNHFTVDKKDYVSLKVSTQFRSNSDMKTAGLPTAEDAKQSNSVSSTVPDPKGILVHFNYGKRFHRTIQCQDIKSFNEAVFQILSSRLTNCKPVEIEYQCGSEWYLLEEADTLEDMLMSSKSELYIRATPEQSSVQINTKQTTTVQSKFEQPTDLNVVPIANENCCDSKLKVETTEEIVKKGKLANVINVSIDHLQRSLAIMIQSVMTRLYGTKETLRELSLLTQALNIERSKIGNSAHQGSKKIDKIKNDITKIVERKCILWESVHANDWDSENIEDWLDHFKKALPRKNKKVLDEDVEAISEESFMSEPADRFLKFIERATHKEFYIFSSYLINFKTQNIAYIDFKKLATSVLSIRNFYSHKHKYVQMISRFQEDVSQITKMSQKIVSWAEMEDDNEENIAYMKDDLKHIQHKHKGHEIENSAKTSQILKALLNLNFNHYGYMLFSALNGEHVDSQLQYLSFIPWSAVIDFDINSKHTGLFSAMCEFDDINHSVETKYLSSKRYVKSFSYANLDHVERADLTKPGHIPWLFPHGDSDDKSDEACPLNDHAKYIREVQKPVFKAVRAIASSITEQKSGKSEAIVNLVLCYGDFACKSKKLPYPQFLDDFLYLCKFLLTNFENIVVLTDNIEICLLLKNTEIKVFNIPLDIFCQVVSDLLTVKDVPPIKLPTPHGLQEITFVEEDFELVHKDIAEHEMRNFIFQKQTEIRQNTDTILETDMKIDEYNLRHEITEELRINFYKCDIVSFVSLDNNDTITREEESDIIAHLRELLEERKSQKTEPAKYVLYHTTGAGATTLSRKIVWQLRTDYPCVILKSNYKYSDKKIRETSQTLKKLYKDVNLPILMLIDEDPSSQIVPELTYRVQTDGIPMVFLHVQRFARDKHHSIGRKSTDSFYFLPSYLTKKDAYNFQEKLCIAFGAEKVFAGYKKLDELTASMIIPKVGDKVQNSIDQRVPRVYGTITQIEYQSNFYEVEVKWDYKKAPHTELCMIGAIRNSKFKRVYIKDISSKTIQLFKTFQLYGVMCLNEEFRIPMKKHVQSCLQTISSKRQQLCMLAHLSILFVFKVAEVLPSRSFQRLCCTIMQQTQTKDFDLMKLIPDPAKEFAMVDALGQFRIVHSIIAEEILDFFLSTSPTTLSELICEFQCNMIYDSEYRNANIESTVECLLYNREFELSKDHFMIRKLFSNVILAIEAEEGKGAAIRVFRSALPLINNHHAYGHLARYLSKKVDNFEEALLVIDNAEALANQSSAIAFVQNIKGDIYRDQLKHYLNTSDKKPNWEDPDEYAYQCHRLACEAYQSSYKASPLHFPLNGEIKVRLLLLKEIKDHVNDFTTSAFNSPSIAESVQKCYQLFKKLEEYIKHGDGGKGPDYDSRQTSVTVLKVQFYNIIEHNSEKQKQTLQNFIDSPVKSENKTHCRRWFVELCLLQKNPVSCKTSTKSSHSLLHYNYYYLLNLLEDNLSIVGHNTIDMKLWLSIVRKLPVGTDMEKIEDKLLKWKHKSSTVDENSMLVNFYLTIFYFIKLISCDKTDAPPIISSFNEANVRVQRKSTEDKSRSRVREWLQAAGEGFQCLRSDQQDLSAMRWLEGTVIILSKQESPLISWKGIHVFLDIKTCKPFKDGQHVKFTVGFSLRGVRAITVEPTSRSITPDSATMKDFFTFP